MPSASVLDLIRISLGLALCLLGTRAIIRFMRWRIMLRDTNETVPDCYLQSLAVQFNVSGGFHNEPASLPTLLSYFLPPLVVHL